MDAQILQTDILWQYVDESKSSARILQVHSYQPEIILPDDIDRVPVTEIGAYCFSASEPRIRGEYFHTNEEQSKQIPAANGQFVIKVKIPSHVTTLHNAAFYNCRKLTTLSFGTEMKSIGSDVFTNCRDLKKIEIRSSYTKPTGLNVIIERLESDITVSFLKEHEEMRLFFPEYYEWLDEITPAHIFSRSIEGEGFRMRRAFTNHIFDFKKYDQCYANAIPTENVKSLCEIAYWRLVYPVQLEEDARIQYEKILREHTDVIFDLAIKAHDLQRLLFPVKHFSLEIEVISKARNLCLEADWAEGATMLMEEQQKRWKKKPKTFDFDF